MKQTFPIMPALYVVKTPTEVFNANGESLKVGAKHSALGQYAVPKRGSTATPATISYAGLAVKRCKITGY